METIKILEKRENLSWEYDDEADVLYISVGEPGPAEGVDIGEGVIVRIDPENREVIGLTILGISKKVLKEIAV
jgi:uncharacterized protein YuzE